MVSMRRSVTNSWTPDADHAPTKTEIFCNSDDASGGGFALAMAERHGPGRPWLWVQDSRSRKLGGLPYFHGLPNGLRHQCHYVAADKAEDVLFALEEGLRCPALGFVIGEIAGDPKALGFTQSRRLAVASEAHGVTLYLLRTNAARSLSAARMRWAITAAQSQAPSTNPKAPGAPAWQAELFRSRIYQPSRWTLARDTGQLSITTAGDRVDLAAVSGDRPLAEAG